MNKRRVAKWLVLGSCCLVVEASGMMRPTATVPAARPSVADHARPSAGRAPVPAGTLLKVAAAPMHFERNEGQAPAEVKFTARGAGYAVALTATETAVVLLAHDKHEDRGALLSSIVRTRLVNASTPAAVTGESTLPGTVNYFHGTDPARWRHGVPTYGRVRASGVYPGIDAVYYGNQRQLQYDFIVAPGADPGRIGLAFDGIDDLEIGPAGDLVLRAGDQALRQNKPYTYQDTPNGRVEVTSRFVLNGERQVGFDVGDYDRSRPLVIDPVLTYSSYFGGDSEEVAFDVAIGPDGSVHLTGITAGNAAFPTLNPFQPASGTQPDAFITKFVSSGDTLVLAFSSYLGGSDQENSDGYGYTGDVAVDAVGTVYLTGSTRSSDFPVTPGAFDPAWGGNLVPDAFFARISSTGQLLYATYLGGTDADVALSIALGPGDVAYIYGNTSSDAVTEQAPVTSNAYDQVMDGESDAFVARFTAAGALDYFTFIGGSGGEAASYNGAIAVDSAGMVYVASDTTSSNNFLPASNGFDTTLGSLSNAGFFLKLNTSLVGAAQVVYASYISGTNGQLWAYGVAATDTGIAYIVGGTSTSTGLPINNAIQPTYAGGNRDAYVIKVDTTQTGANSLLYSTYLGGDQADVAWDVAVDPRGRAVVSGSTFSSAPQVVVTFPLVDQVASCPTFVRISPFVTIFNAAGSAIEQSSCFASSYHFYGVAVSPAGEIWLAGNTDDVTTNPPTAGGVPMVNAEQGTYGRDFPGNGGDYDVLLVRLSPSTDLRLEGTASPNPVFPGGALTYTLTLTNAGSDPASSVWVVDDPLPGTLTFTSCAATNGGVCGGFGNSRWIRYDSLAAGASSTITIVAAVSATAGAGRIISNTARLTSATADPVHANDSVTVHVSTPTLTPGGDADNDGLINDFETKYGLNPFLSGGENGADGDPDADGRTNLQEQQDDTHPRGFVTTYFAEGATGAFFDTRIAILNTSSTPALVLTRFQRGDGMIIRDYRVVPPEHRATIDVEGIAGLEAAEFSTLIEADVPVAADRTMTWDSTGYGSHAERGILAGTATRWYFAEGATLGKFNLFYLIQNPNTQPAQVRVIYLLPSGPPLVKEYAVAPQSRFNIWVNDEGRTDPTLSRLVNAELSAVLESINGVPIIAERAMYLDQPGRPFGAGHESAGVTAPSTRWFLAEGATGTYFDEFILIANPQPANAAVQADFLLADGQVITKTYTVAGNTRFNIWVDLEDPRLADAAVSTRITSTNGVPIIVERSMWWPGPTSDTWQEAHNSPGDTTTGTEWAMADGEVGGARHTETYVLIANTSTFAGKALVTLIFEDGTDSISRVFPLAADSRTSIAASVDFPEALGKRFGVLVESVDFVPPRFQHLAQIVVERSMYSDAAGVRWAAGTNALATKLR
jgi:uncharacterized repeat protein (TIGR01451 family)